jgi:MFS family permease
MVSTPIVKHGPDSDTVPSQIPSVQQTKLARLRSRTKPLAFAVICGSITLDSFNVTGLTYGLVNIAKKFDVIPATASWVLSAYALAFGSLLLLAGRAGENLVLQCIYNKCQARMSSSIMLTIYFCFQVTCTVTREFTPSD